MTLCHRETMDGTEGFDDDTDELLSCKGWNKPLVCVNEVYRHTYVISTIFGEKTEIEDVRVENIVPWSNAKGWRVVLDNDRSLRAVDYDEIAEHIQYGRLKKLERNYWN